MQERLSEEQTDQFHLKGNPTILLNVHIMGLSLNKLIFNVHMTFNMNEVSWPQPNKKDNHPSRVIQSNHL